MPPPARKARRLDDGTTASVSYEIRYINHDFSPHSTYPTVDAYVVTALPPKLISAVLKASGDLPECLHHLMRVSGHKEVLVGFEVPPGVKKFLADHPGEGEVVQRRVPGKPPLIRREYDVASKIWPIRFTENERNEALALGFDGSDDLADFYAQKLLVMAQDTENGRCVIHSPSKNLTIVEKISDSPFVLTHACYEAADELSRLAVTKPELEIFHGNGTDALVTMEPCVACAMALIHMRVQRIIFVRRNKKRGAFTRDVKLHECWEHLHKMDVFQIFFDEK